MNGPGIFDHHEPEWCPGCGNFSILECVKQALAGLGEDPRGIVVVGGIGQTAKLAFSLKCNMFTGLHGRALPLALGMKLAGHETKIIAVSGDGCLYSEGGNHLVHNARRNVDVTVLAGDNRVFGLTKGQASPTSGAGFVTRVHPEGTGSAPLSPPLFALASGATFVARGFSGRTDELTGLIKEGIRHRGFSLIDILFPCVSFNKVNTFSWYNDRVEPVEPEHDRTDFRKALALAVPDGETIRTGIYYRAEKPVFGEDRAALADGSIAARTAGFTPERVRPLFDKYR